MEARNICP